MDKKKIARVIATIIISFVMFSVFILDIVTLVLCNKYEKNYEITTEDFSYKNGNDRIHFLNTGNSAWKQRTFRTYRFRRRWWKPTKNNRVWRLQRRSYKLFKKGCKKWKWRSLPWFYFRYSQPLRPHWCFLRYYKWRTNKNRQSIF